MGIPIHTIVAPDGANGFTQSGYASIGLILDVAYGAGAAAGDVVTQTVTVPASGGLPENYAVFVEAGADVTAWVSAKTATGLTVNIEPRLATGTLAAGTVNLLIIA